MDVHFIYQLNIGIIGMVAGWLDAERLAGVLVGRSVGLVIGLAGWPAAWLAGRAPGRSAGLLYDRPVWWLAGW